MESLWQRVVAGWRSPRGFLLCFAVAVPLAHTTWRVLLNNYAIEVIHFDGARMGLLQSLREVPGLLTMTLLLWLCWIREQSMAMVALVLLGIGVACTGYVPTTAGLLATTVLMSFGFHYGQALEQSLTLQWVPRAGVHRMLSSMVRAASIASVLAFIAMALLLHLFDTPYRLLYVWGGIATVVCAGLLLACSRFPTPTPQHTGFVLRRRYWRYYLLTFLGGARRQIFVVFAGFMLVERFHFAAKQMALLFLFSELLTIGLAPHIGRWIKRCGERRALLIEHGGLVLVFLGYTVAQYSAFAVGLYLLDHLCFALAIALKSYFQHIADPADIASTSSVSSTINHIAAVMIPVTFGLLWLHDYRLVFWIGAGIAALSWLCALAIPRPAGTVSVAHPGSDAAATPKSLPALP